MSVTAPTRPAPLPPPPVGRPRPARAELVERLRLQLYGAAFLVVVAGLAGLSIASYRQLFTPTLRVTLETDRAGSQLSPGADVKLRGILVGQVRRISTTGSGARLELALDPSLARLVPGNVQAELLPKTLFGERFVELVPPARPAAPIRAGAVIPQDRSADAVELQQVFDQLMPILQAVQPAKLSETLSALADALEGRGGRLGAGAAQLNDYLAGLQPRLGQLDADLSGLAEVASTYADAAPDLLRLAANLPVTATTLAQQRAQLTAFLTETSGLARQARGLLAEDGDRLIRLAALDRPVLATLARYSPEFPCLLTGLQHWQPNIDAAFRNARLHLTLDVVYPRQAYRPGQQPRYEEVQGPNCRGLPDPGVPAPAVRLRDGSEGGGSTRSGSTGSGAGATTLPAALPAALAGAPAGSGSFGGGSLDSGSLDSGLAGTAAERQLVDALLAPQLGVPAGQVPAIADLLWAPLARGTEVDLQETT